MNKKNISSLPLLAALLLMVFGLPASSAEQGPPSINIGIIELVPYALPENNAGKTGYIVEITEKIRTAINLPGRDEILPPRRLVGHLQKGKLDCTILARVASSEASFDMIVPIGKHIESVIVPRAGVNLSSYEDLKNLIIAVPSGVNLDKRFNQDDTQQKFATSGYRESTKMLQHGRVDAMLGVWDSYLYNMRELGMEREKIGAPLVLNQAPLWFMCRPGYKNEAVKKQVTNAIIALRDNGTFKNIIASYLGDIR